ncbi:MAG: PxxKW family cysteine-rich protein [Syntrophales bacterium]|nr:PxxKW family cysteine-rich protein [Syntrophales bacterium]
MSKRGCTFTGGSCLPIIDKCEGCERAKPFESGTYCSIYADPGSKWVLGLCPMATHIKREYREVTQKINPLKAAKRAARSRRK